jgi:predicted O-methyltransferase YrrM
MGRRYIAIELDESHARTARERLHHASETTKVEEHEKLP